MVFMLSCNNFDTKISLVDSTRPNVDTITKYITEYIELEQESTVLEITRREKINKLYQLNKENNTVSKNEEIEFLPDKKTEYSKEFEGARTNENSQKSDTLNIFSILEKLRNDLKELSIDSMNLANKMKSILLIVPLDQIKTYRHSQYEKPSQNQQTINYRNESAKKCNDQRSYDLGFNIASDQIGKGLMADCEYLFVIAKSQNDNIDHYCFCKGVNDWIAKNR